MPEALTERVFTDDDVDAIDPLALFEEWFELARTNEANDPNAMAVASIDSDGMPDVRMVLLNQRDARGFCFFTNFESEKGRQMLGDPRAALLFHWKSIRRQVRMRGAAEVVSAEEADAYWARRPTGSQIASAVSQQSRPLASRAHLASAVAERTTEVGEGAIERPPHWSGFRMMPTTIEFWKDGAFRLHDRVRFTRSEADEWTRQRLYP